MTGFETFTNTNNRHKIENWHREADRQRMASGGQPRQRVILLRALVAKVGRVIRALRPMGWRQQDVTKAL